MRALLVQPKRLALFAYLLLAAPPRLHRRDSLLALFWPESGEEQARRALRQALHFLRQSLGPEIVVSRGAEEIGVDFAAIACDVRAFEEALEAGRREEALVLYRGPLLEGFHVSGVAPELEQWLEDERARLRARAVAAASALAEEADRAGNHTLAVQRLRDILRLDPDAEAALRRLMTLLERAGDRAGALRAYHEFARHLAADVGVEPSRETTVLAERMRSGDAGEAPATPHAAAPPADAEAPSPPWAVATPARLLHPGDLALATGATAHPPRSAGRPSIARRAAVAAGILLAAALVVVAGRRGARVPPDESSRPPAARRFLDEGVRAYYQGDRIAALRFFRAALAEDSTYAAAALFGGQAAAWVDGDLTLPLLAQAVRMSARGPERERLLSREQWAETTNHPALVPIAESLARAFPRDFDAHFALGRALAWSGEFAAAVPHLEEAIARDSAVLARLARARPATDAGPAPCPSCEVLSALANVHATIDSGDAAERVAREWVRREPRSPRSWLTLAVILGWRGRVREALEVLDARQARFADAPPDDGFERAKLALRRGDFAGADRILAADARGGGPTVRREALWWQVVSLRAQGRLREALRIARDIRAESGDALPEAQVLFESGRGLDAARLFEGMAANVTLSVPSGAPDSAPGLRTRRIAWYLAHVAAAHAAAGDTLPLGRLRDSLAVLGASGAYGRDRRLHFHVDGLLLLARGRPEAAAVAFRQALGSPTLGYTRTNLELGRVLLALGRPREAAAVLAPALRGDLQGSNYYVTHAELHAELARAFRAMGARDSARVHAAWVERAWRGADPAFLATHARAALPGRP